MGIVSRVGSVWWRAFLRDADMGRLYATFKMLRRVDAIFHPGTNLWTIYRPFWVFMYNKYITLEENSSFIQAQRSIKLSSFPRLTIYLLLPRGGGFHFGIVQVWRQCVYDYSIELVSLPHYM